MVVPFQVSSGSVECHKLLLAVANPVFKSLFHGPIMMNEKKVKVHCVSHFGSTVSQMTKEVVLVKQLNKIVP